MLIRISLSLSMVHGGRGRIVLRVCTVSFNHFKTSLTFNQATVNTVIHNKLQPCRVWVYRTTFFNCMHLFRWLNIQRQDICFRRENSPLASTEDQLSGSQTFMAKQLQNRYLQCPVVQNGRGLSGKRPNIED